MYGAVFLVFLTVLFFLLAREGDRNTLLTKIIPF
jgi:hypothetical protein